MSLLLIVPCFGQPLERNEIKRVLLLGSTDPNTPAMLGVTSGVMEILAKESPASVELFSESLDADRFDRPDHPNLFEQNYLRKYAGRRFDAVIAVAPMALQFAVQRGARLWPGVPVIFGAVTQEQYKTARVPPSFRGFTMEFPILETVRESLRLLPKTQKIILVFGCNAGNRRDAAITRDVFQQQLPGVAVDDLGCLTMAEYRARVSSMPPRTLLVWGNLNQDRDGSRLAPLQAAFEILPSANAPVVSIWSAHLEAGLMGGKMVNPAAVGSELAREVLRVFRGDPPNPSGPAEANWWMWDARQLARFGIRESQLPTGSQVVNRPFNVWAAYGHWIAGSLLFLVVQSLLVAYLLLERSRRGRAQQRLRELSGSLIRAQEEERARIARELHDDLNQRVGLLTIELDHAARSAPELWQGRLQALAKRTRELSGGIHDLAHQLHPAKLKYLGLVPAIREICQEIALQHGINIDVEASELSFPLEPETTICVYRAIQEALQNIVRHSRADEVKILLTEVQARLEVVIIDNGVGFEPHSATMKFGLGLASMRERLRLVQGHLRVESALGAGTTLRIVAPL